MQTLVDPFELAIPITVVTAMTESPAPVTPTPPPVAIARAPVDTRPGNAFDDGATTPSDAWARARCWCSEE
jgi:hypothetical protein